ncbi:uncharacterized protein LOC121347187 [Onychostruthus taczanowskii]|uniref:uncharacterized protein LOC121347187 n=1 Tax=Onychostruthus taczanowskii TaxID=356909 RepID=UPI001B80B847|nr:uncharacterized protein LOC121347187 [Onychostruthus taczanowskii]
MRGKAAIKKVSIPELESNRWMRCMKCLAAVLCSEEEEKGEEEGGSLSSFCFISADAVTQLSRQAPCSHVSINFERISNFTSLILSCQSAQSLPAEAGGTWPASSQHNICCYLIETILLRDAGQRRGDRSCRSKIEHGRKQGRLKHCGAVVDLQNPAVPHRPFLIFIPATGIEGMLFLAVSLVQTFPDINRWLYFCKTRQSATFHMQSPSVL